MAVSSSTLPANTYITCSVGAYEYHFDDSALGNTGAFPILNSQAQPVALPTSSECFGSGFNVSASPSSGIKYSFSAGSVFLISYLPGIPPSTIALVPPSVIAIATTADTGPQSSTSSTTSSSGSSRSATVSWSATSSTTSPSATQMNNPPSTGDGSSKSGAHSSPSPTASSKPPKNKSYSSGDVAGAAVGAAIGAALLVGLLFFFMRKRRGRRSNGSTELVVHGKGYSNVDSPGTISSGTEWMQHVPQPADDKVVATRIKTLFNQIELHVENFYHNTDLSSKALPNEAQQALSILDPGQCSSSLQHIFLHSSERANAIKHALAYLVVTRLSAQEPSSDSFLPMEYVTAIRTLNQKKGSEISYTFTQPLSRYRIMTAYLRPDPSLDQDYLQRRDASINRAVTTFNTAMQPWSSNRPGGASKSFKNLVEIMRSAADAGIFLFGHPATFEFDWKNKKAREKHDQRLVILPAFLKIADNNGVMLAKPLVMVDQFSKKI